jgi:hypothetical protein
LKSAQVPWWIPSSANSPSHRATCIRDKNL